jgi:hypothetical protein
MLSSLQYLSFGVKTLKIKSKDKTQSNESNINVINDNDNNVLKLFINKREQRPQRIRI